MSKVATAITEIKPDLDLPSEDSVTFGKYIDVRQLSWISRNYSDKILWKARRKKSISLNVSFFFKKAELSQFLCEMVQPSEHFESGAVQTCANRVNLEKCSQLDVRAKPASIQPRTNPDKFAA